jgi:succinoglycan biosynthesis protein ExoV
MKLFYYKDSIGNFGDDLNPWLWSQLFSKSLDSYYDNDTLFIGIGSLLNHKIPDIPSKKIIFGSGYGYGDIPIITNLWRFFCVRGPLTAQKLNIPKSLAITDSAILVRKLMEPAQRVEFFVSFMPHHQTARYDDWQSVCEDLGIIYLDPAAPVERNLEIIRKSNLVITESLHGAIIADAFRVPWIPVRTRPRIFDFKWQDWSQSLKLEHHFELLPPAWKENIDRKWKKTASNLTRPVASIGLRWLIKYGKRRLSNEIIFNQVYDRLLESFYAMVSEADH